MNKKLWRYKAEVHVPGYENQLDFKIKGLILTHAGVAGSAPEKDRIEAYLKEKKIGEGNTIIKLKLKEIPMV